MQLGPTNASQCVLQETGKVDVPVEGAEAKEAALMRGGPGFDSNSPSTVSGAWQYLDFLTRPGGFSFVMFSLAPFGFGLSRLLSKNEPELPPTQVPRSTNLEPALQIYHKQTRNQHKTQSKKCLQPLRFCLGRHKA